MKQFTPIMKTHSFEQKYRTDLDALYSAFLDLGNPFKEEEEESLVQLSSKVMMDEASFHSVKQASQKGKEKYQAFVTERLCCQDVSFCNNITKNNLPLFRQKKSIVTSKSKLRIMSLNADRRLYSHLYIACQSRKGDLDSFFSHENHSYLSPYQNMAS